MHNLAKNALQIAKEIRKDIPAVYVPPSEGTIPRSQMILPHALVKGTRGYIEKVLYQINGAYENGWYDACAVMIRRFVETLIIELFEHYNLADKIKNTNGDFFFLSDLITATLNERTWNLGRNTKQALPKLKDIGDKSAHSRRYNAYREDIDKLTNDLRTVAQELLYLAKLK